MTPPESESQHTNDIQPSSGARGRGRGRGRDRGREPSREPEKLFCHFHGPDSDHRTIQRPEKKKTLERMESEKKAKLVGHTTWPKTPQTQPLQIQYTQPPFVPPPPFVPNIPPIHIQLQLQPQLAAAAKPSNTTESTHHPSSANTRAITSPPPHQSTHQSKKTKPQIANPRHYQPSG